LMSGIHPLFVLIVAGGVFYAAFIAAGFWLKIPNVDERQTLRMWYARLLRAGRA